MNTMHNNSAEHMNAHVETPSSVNMHQHIQAVHDHVSRIITQEDSWRFDEQERTMMRQSGYVFE